MTNSFYLVSDSNRNSKKIRAHVLKKIKITSIKKSKAIIVIGGDGFMLHTLKKFQIIGYQKKPNDIYINGEKIAGILLSNLGSINTKPYQALSIGMNINSNLELDKIDSSLKVKSTSLLRQTGDEYNREDILCKIIESIDKAIQKLVYL